MRFGAPKLEKLEDLALTLGVVERGETGASKVLGSEDNGTAGIAIEPAFRNESADGGRLHGVEFYFSEVAIGKHEADGR
jgi:hypothetical protein